MTEAEKTELRNLLAKGRFLRMRHLVESVCASILTETQIKLNISHPRQIVWHSLHQCDIPVCDECEGAVSWTGDMPNMYRQYCGNKCRGIATAKQQKIANLEKYGVEWHTQREDCKEKAKQTNLERYGVENGAQSPITQAKMRRTNIERYGTEHAMKSIVIQEKAKQTNLERYGTMCSLQNKEVKKKAVDTMIEKYGVEHALQNPELLQKSQSTCMANHGVTIPGFSKEIVDKIIKTNRERYGANAPTCNKEILEKIKQTNLKRFGVEHSRQSHYSDECLKFFQDPQIFSEECQAMSVKELSIKYGISDTTIYKYVKQFDITLPTGIKSGFETEIVSLVNKNHSGTIIYSDRKTISPKELDIYLPDLKLAIECNGTYWHSENNGRGKEYHVNKTQACMDKGISLIHVWEHEWLTKRPIIESMILYRLGKSNAIFARKTDIFQITPKIAREFYNANHIQGAAPVMDISFGLFYNGELIAAMTFGKSRFNKKYEWEIIRFASSLGHTVVGGASKLFNYFIKSQAPSSVVSYAAKGHTTGGVYKKLGMDHVGTTRPAYYYTKNYVKFSNRQAFQKHKLNKILEQFDPEKTEWENMKMNGYDRIWDSGNDIFVWAR